MFRQKREPRPADAKPPKFGMVVVDMPSQADMQFLSYRHGSLQDGISRICSLIRLCERCSIPCIAVGCDSSEYPSVPLRLFTNALPLPKPDGEYSVLENPDVGTSLRARGVDTIAVCGYDRSTCVMWSARHALRLGYSVATSDQLMFGPAYLDEHFNLIGERRVEGEARWDLRWFYRRKTRYFETAEALASAMAAASGMKGEPPWLSVA